MVAFPRPLPLTPSHGGEGGQQLSPRRCLRYPSFGGVAFSSSLCRSARRVTLSLRGAHRRRSNPGGGEAHSVARKLTYTFLNPATLLIIGASRIVDRPT